MKTDLRAQELNSESSAPLYQQIFSLLRSRIVNGVFAFNSKLPAEETLAAELGVSRITVKRAMNELAASGFVKRFRGRGTIVSYTNRTPPVLGNYSTLMGHLKRLGFETEIELKLIEVAPANLEVASKLFIEPGTNVQYVERVRHLEDAPFSHIRNYTPIEIASKFTEAEIAYRPFITLLAEAGHEVVSAEQVIQAQSVRGSVAKALMLADGAAVLTIRRVLRDRSGKAVQFTISTHRADRFQYHMIIDDLADKPGSD